MGSEAGSRLLAAQVRDLRAEGAALDALLVTLNEPDWSRITTFKRWTVFDVIAHLHFSDHLGLATLLGEGPFRDVLRDMRKSGLDSIAYTRRWLGTRDGSELSSRWRVTFDELCNKLSDADPDQQLAWGGPGMKPRMFATARLMEIWAHGWEIFDIKGVARTHADRLRHVADIGVRTYAWTFANRKIAVPGPAPHVRLTAPSGARWTWNDPQPDNHVTGDAVSFCQVVTQVRNVADTSLEVKGEPAQRWMALAQCFAGPPEDPPPPGVRGSARRENQDEGDDEGRR